MAGRKRNRQQEKRQGASAAKAAQLLPSHLSSGKFISLGDITEAVLGKPGASEDGGREPSATKTAAAFASTVPTADLALWDDEAARIAQRLMKRDQSTKLRALADLREHLSRFGPAGREGVSDRAIYSAKYGAFVGNFGVAFRRLALDKDNRVRGESAQLVGQVVQAFGRNIVSALPELLPSWTGLRGDASREVAVEAERAFVASFPSAEKQRKALRLCRRACWERAVEWLAASADLSGGHRAAAAAEERETLALHALTAVRLALEASVPAADEEADASWVRDAQHLMVDLWGAAANRRAFLALPSNVSKRVREAFWRCAESLLHRLPSEVWTEAITSDATANKTTADHVVDVFARLAGEMALAETDSALHGHVWMYLIRYVSSERVPARRACTAIRTDSVAEWVCGEPVRGGRAPSAVELLDAHQTHRYVLPFCIAYDRRWAEVTPVDSGAGGVSQQPPVPPLSALVRHLSACALRRRDQLAHPPGLVGRARIEWWESFLLCWCEVAVWFAASHADAYEAMAAREGGAAAGMWSWFVDGFIAGNRGRAADLDVTGASSMLFDAAHSDSSALNALLLAALWAHVLAWCEAVRARQPEAARQMGKQVAAGIADGLWRPNGAELVRALHEWSSTTAESGTRQTSSAMVRMADRSAYLASWVDRREATLRSLQQQLWSRCVEETATRLLQTTTDMKEGEEDSVRAAATVNRAERLLAVLLRGGSSDAVCKLLVTNAEIAATLCRWCSTVLSSGGATLRQSAAELLGWLAVAVRSMPERRAAHAAIEQCPMPWLATVARAARTFCEEADGDMECLDGLWSEAVWSPALQSAVEALEARCEAAVARHGGRIPVTRRQPLSADPPVDLLLEYTRAPSAWPVDAASPSDALRSRVHAAMRSVAGCGLLPVDIVATVMRHAESEQVYDGDTLTAVALQWLFQMAEDERVRGGESVGPSWGERGRRWLQADHAAELAAYLRDLEEEEEQEERQLAAAWQCALHILAGAQSIPWQTLLLQALQRYVASHPIHRDDHRASRRRALLERLHPPLDDEASPVPPDTWAGLLLQEDTRHWAARCLARGLQRSVDRRRRGADADGETTSEAVTFGLVAQVCIRVLERDDYEQVLPVMWRELGGGASSVVPSDTLAIPIPERCLLPTLLATEPTLRDSIERRYARDFNRFGASRTCAYVVQAAMRHLGTAVGRTEAQASTDMHAFVVELLTRATGTLAAALREALAGPFLESLHAEPSAATAMSPLVSAMQMLGLIENVPPEYARRDDLITFLRTAFELLQLEYGEEERTPAADAADALRISWPQVHATALRRILTPSLRLFADDLDAVSWDFVVEETLQALDTRSPPEWRLLAAAVECAAVWLPQRPSEWRRTLAAACPPSTVCLALRAWQVAGAAADAFHAGRIIGGEALGDEFGVDAQAALAQVLQRLHQMRVLVVRSASPEAYGEAREANDAVMVLPVPAATSTDAADARFHGLDILHRLLDADAPALRQLAASWLHALIAQQNGNALLEAVAPATEMVSSPDGLDDESAAAAAIDDDDDTAFDRRVAQLARQRAARRQRLADAMRDFTGALRRLPPDLREATQNPHWAHRQASAFFRRWLTMLQMCAPRLPTTAADDIADDVPIRTLLPDDLVQQLFEAMLTQVARQYIAPAVALEQTRVRELLAMVAITATTTTTSNNITELPADPTVYFEYETRRLAAALSEQLLTGADEQVVPECLRDVSEVHPSPSLSAAVWAARAFFLTLLIEPSTARHWFVHSVTDRVLAGKVEALLNSRSISAALTAREIDCARRYAARANQDPHPDGPSALLSVRGSLAARELTAAYHVEDVSIEVALLLPDAYPLRSVRVEMRSGAGVGMSESRQRKTLMHMTRLVQRGADGRAGSALVASIALWRRSMDRVLRDAAECPICYSVLHARTGRVARIACPTCHYRFHAECLYRWFRGATQGATCPLCRSPF